MLQNIDSSQSQATDEEQAGAVFLETYPGQLQRGYLSDVW
jgi:hypothetical protein